MKRTNSFFFIFIFTVSVATSQSPEDCRMDNLVKKNLNLAVLQYKFLLHNVPPDVMPRTFNASTDQIITSDTKWWTSGFYPGTLLYLYEYSKDTMLLHEAEKRLELLEKEKINTGSHDLGFMFFCSFGNAYRIIGRTEYKEVLNTAASSLATRYRSSAEAIQSWDAGEKYHCPVIIDNMMNLELLFWVSNNGGETRFRDIAVSHANTTLINHFRPDNSSWHLVDFDPTNGEVIRKMTVQGASDSSAWARGQSWGLYGYTMMYRFTLNKKYLDKARDIADFILNHPKMPADGIPYWDYDAPDIPDTYRDASSASILASALIELSGYVNRREALKYKKAVEKILISLSSDTYHALPGTNGGFILMHSVGSLPGNSEVDVALIYADYYYIEALLRYRNQFLN
jgi:unsaturated chondroitin disaccharide hydrolase